MRQTRRIFRLALPACAPAACLLGGALVLGAPSAPALAQGVNGGTGSGGAADILRNPVQPVVPTAKLKRNTEAPPPAIPGAAASSGAASPARPTLDMAPNDALFDAINRGDAAAARDALNRGAELETRNVLGQTPLDAAIDLGRKDITFLLLSMRGAGGSAAAPQPASAGTDAAAASRPSRTAPAQAAAARRPTVQRASVERVVPRHAAPEAAPAPRTPKLFAGDGGAPIPQAGFLGFGSSAAR